MMRARGVVVAAVLGGLGMSLLGSGCSSDDFSANGEEASAGEAGDTGVAGQTGVSGSSGGGGEAGASEAGGTSGAGGEAGSPEVGGAGTGGASGGASGSSTAGSVGTAGNGGSGGSNTCTPACGAGQTCIAGECLVRDGYACVAPSECVSGKCTTFYVDADGDTHGSAAGAKAVCGTAPPPGYVTSRDDCCDTGGDAANIFPGQKKFFTTQATSCNKGWDYDCSNNIELEIAQATITCKPNPIGQCPVGPAWSGTTIPACGVPGSGSNCISPSGSANTGNSNCATSQPMPKTQGCH